MASHFNLLSIIPSLKSVSLNLFTLHVHIIYLESINSGREFKDNVLASKLLVNRRESVELVFERSGILGVKEDLEGLGTINLLTESLTNNFGGEDHIVQDGIVDSSQGTTSRTRLLVVGTTSGNRQDTTLSNEDNVAVRELLFEFTGESDLNLLESTLKRNGDEDDNSLLTSTKFDLGIHYQSFFSFTFSIKLTSLAAVIWRGRNSFFKSATEDSKSKRA